MRALLPVLFLETACLPVVPAPYKCDPQDSAEPVADTATEDVETIGGPVEEERAHIHVELCEIQPWAFILSEGDEVALACYKFTSPDGGVVSGLSITEHGVPVVASDAIFLIADGQIISDNVFVETNGQAHFGSLDLFIPEEGLEVASAGIIGGDSGITHIQHELTSIKTDAELTKVPPLDGNTFPVNN